MKKFLGLFLTISVALASVVKINATEVKEKGMDPWAQYECMGPGIGVVKDYLPLFYPVPFCKDYTYNGYGFDINYNAFEFNKNSKFWFVEANNYYYNSEYEKDLAPNFTLNGKNSIYELRLTNNFLKTHKKININGNGQLTVNRIAVEKNKTNDRGEQLYHIQSQIVDLKLFDKNNKEFTFSDKGFRDEDFLGYSNYVDLLYADMVMVMDYQYIPTDRNFDDLLDTVTKDRLSRAGYYTSLENTKAAYQLLLGDKIKERISDFDHLEIEFEDYESACINGDDKYACLKEAKEFEYVKVDSCNVNNYFTYGEDFKVSVDDSSIIIKNQDFPEKMIAPVIKLGTSNNNTQQITWDEVYANKYYVYRATSKTGKYTKIATVETNSYTDKSLTYGTTYYYKVMAQSDELGKSGYSNIVSKKIVPNKVANLNASSIGTNNIKLSWDKVSASGYELYRSTDNKKWSKVSTITKNATVTYNNTKLTANKTYYYKVRAYKTVGTKKIYGSYSTVLKTKTAPNKAKVTVSLKSDFTNNFTLNVKVTAVSGASIYKIYRAESSTGTYELVSTLESAGTYNDINTIMGKTYYYKVKACNSTGSCSGYSSVASKKQTPSAYGFTLLSYAKLISLAPNPTSKFDGIEVYKATSKTGKYTLKHTMYYDDGVYEYYDESCKVGTTYYYKIRTYVLVDGKKVYSPFSSVKSIKCVK